MRGEVLVFAATATIETYAVSPYFQLDNVRYRIGKRAKVHFDLVTLVYNASKLTTDRINAALNSQKQAA